MIDKFLSIQRKYSIIYEGPDGIPFYTYTRVSQKKVGFAAPGAKLYLFCATLLYDVFSIFFENENPQTFFFSQNQKFRKAKMCI